MKHSLVRSINYTLAVAVCAWTISACTQEEMASTSVETDINTADIDYVTSEAELSQMLSDAGYEVTDETTLDFKMNFLSNKIAQEYHESSVKNGRTMVDEIVCIAQIFDGSDYLTDVDTGENDQIIRARSFLDLLGPDAPQGFVGTNANIYLNGINIGGRIDNSLNRSDCQSPPPLDIVEYYADAMAYYYPNGTIFVSAKIECLDEGDAD